MDTRWHTPVTTADGSHQRTSARLPGFLFRLIVLLPLAACGDGPSPTTDSGTPPAEDAGPIPESGTLEIGTGFDAFVPIAEGDTVELTPGCQGAQHVWISLRTTELLPRRNTIELELVRESDSMVLSDDYRVRLSLTPAGDHAEITGLTLVVPDPEPAVGEDVAVEGTVEDDRGVRAEDRRSFHLEWGEAAPCF